MVGGYFMDFFNELYINFVKLVLRQTQTKEKDSDDKIRVTMLTMFTR